MAETSAGDGHKGYAEESMGEPLPLPAVEEMDGAAQLASSCSLLSFIFIERWEMCCIQYLAVALINLPVVSATKLRADSFCIPVKSVSEFLRRAP